VQNTATGDPDKVIETLDFIQTGGLAFNTDADERARGARLITLSLQSEGQQAATDPDTGAIDPANPAVAPVVEYTTEPILLLDYFDMDDEAQHWFYNAGSNWYFGPVASFWALVADLFGYDRYDSAWAITQWFGDTFQFAMAL